ncbi:MAG TPA: TrkA family potassium uptake protein [Firmicutes bacterium]|nr:TrkA family potassium uptake protein [Bacillota bacterium]
MKEFAVIGLGRFGQSVAVGLASLGESVLGIDLDEARVNEVSHQLTKVVQADATDEEVLRSLGLRNFDVVVVAVGSLEASILITLGLKEMGVKYVIAKASSDAHAKVLTKIGADRIVLPEKEMGTRVAYNLSSSNILDVIELSPEYSVIEVSADGELVGRTLRTLDLRNKYGVNVLAIKRGASVNLSPRAEDRIEKDDVLVLVGTNTGLKRVQELTTK